MTEEQMAKEYCNNNVPFDTTESGEKLYTENDLKHAYLAGLKAGKHREWSFVDENPKARSVFGYYHNEANLPVGDFIQIRENGGEWHVPLIEVE